MDSYQLIIRDEEDIYEVTVQHRRTIASIRKFIGESQTPRDVEFDNLHPDVQSKIEQGINEAQNNLT